MKHEPGMAYKSSTLHKVFAFLSILLLFCTLGMFLDDYIRPWKGWQIKALAVKEEKLKKDIEEKLGTIDKEKLAQVEAQIVEGTKIAAERETEINVIAGKLNEVKAKIHAKKLELSVYNGQVSELTFNWEMAVEKKKPGTDKMKAKLDKNRALYAKTNNEIKSLEGEAKVLRNEIEDKKKILIQGEKAKKRMIGQVELMKQALAKTNTTNPVWIIRNLPFLDFLDPTVKVEQVVLDNYVDDRYFQKVPKVDRCQTCHVFIDKPGYEDQEQPFKTHSNLALMVSRDSPHPKAQFGCTSCHGGEGHRINDFTSIAHTPQNQEQAKEWAAKYNWHEPHKIPQPMLPLQHTEASCYKCHSGVEVIPAADDYNKGKQLVTDYGCYACHVMPGMQEKKKAGPSLKRLAAKLDKNWVKNWIWDPFGFNPHSRMPSFFQQSNNSKPEFMKKNIAEVNAMGEFLFDKNDDSYRVEYRYAGGDTENGKELISSVGCIACHQVEGIESSIKVGSMKGPYLTGTGSKVDKNWLVQWLKKPNHYQADTIMPSFRLTDKEANDMAAYLMSLKNETFEAKRFTNLDKDLRDEILLEYFVAFDTIAAAKKKLERMSDYERTMELGKRSIGKYGCYSCHSIEGFKDDRAPIGPNLAKEGSKPVHQFGFGHEKDVPHTRHDWIEAHLGNPRRWDRGTDKPFKDLTRMPQFYLKDDEIQAMTTYVLGFVDEKIPERGMHKLSPEEKIAEKGFKAIAKYNCAGCHKIDGYGGDILAAYEDDNNEGPPWLVNEGHRIQADWLHHFLQNVHPLRPWLAVRMPSFHYDNNEEINEIVEYFRNKSGELAFDPPPIRVEWEPGERKAALALFEDYACATCHTTGFNNDEAAAPNLYFAKRRLRSSWIKKWLAGPAEILPYTVMPNFWEDGEAQNQDILGGDSDKQIEALTKYLMEIGYSEFHGKMNKSARNR